MQRHKMFKKVLIANRGEIAVRLIRACRELGVQSVAVYSDADAQAMHVRAADEAVCIGPAAATESYLDQAKILEAAREVGAEAIHPGYGFLSENADFAQAVADAGLCFIGPSPAAIRQMGSKAEARAIMIAAGVPVVPGYEGEDQDDARLVAEAERLGFPLLVKAAAGGGGKGMRLVHRAEEMADAIDSARRESLHAFGDQRLILERYITKGRHIEVQILADQYGNVLHLNERECSIQRRHQKIIEEAPSPYVSEALRAEIGAAAVAAAKAVGYVNAGTVEFIVDASRGEAYFLEMNTRLQVEHPVTELTTGLDLAAWQLRIAAGEALDIKATPIPRGHALECRLYAEDPANQFFPSTGQILRFVPPMGPGIRLDTEVEQGDQVTPHYDPMLAKLIVHAADRKSAIRRMQQALSSMVLLGVKTNQGFLQAVLAHPKFQEGETTTQFLSLHLPTWEAPKPPSAVLIAAAISSMAPTASVDSSGQTSAAVLSPWQRLTSLRIGA